MSSRKRAADPLDADTSGMTSKRQRAPYESVETAGQSITNVIKSYERRRYPSPKRTGRYAHQPSTPPSMERSSPMVENTPNTPASHRSINSLQDHVESDAERHSRDTSSSPSTHSRNSSLSSGATKIPAAIEIDALKASIARLQHDLANRYRQAIKKEFRIKQDMMLDLMKEKDKRVEVEKNQKKLENHLERIIKHYQTEKQTHETSMAELTARHTKEQADLAASLNARARADVEVWQQEAEHWQIESGTLQSDLDELRMIENEASSRRKDDARGLPPAYGSLDDESYAVPWEQHADAGALTWGQLKRTIWDRYNEKVAKTNTEVAKLLRGSDDDKRKAGPFLMIMVSSALEEACDCLLAVLNSATQTFAAWQRHVEQKLKTSTRPATSGISGAPDEINDALHIACKMTKLILELCWRTVGFLEVRPTAYQTVSHFRTQLGLYFAKIDDALLQSLKTSLHTKLLLKDLSCYHVQVRAVKNAFSNLSHNVSYRFFKNTIQWLSEQIEKEREMEADRPAFHGIPPSGPVAVPGAVRPRATEVIILD